LKIERSSDLIYYTYYMVDWGKVEQRPSSRKCLQCGSVMKEVEPVRDSKGATYDGFVCHSCKQVLWVKAD